MDGRFFACPLIYVFARSIRTSLRKLHMTGGLGKLAMAMSSVLVVVLLARRTVLQDSCQEDRHQFVPMMMSGAFRSSQESNLDRLRLGPSWYSSWYPFSLTLFLWGCVDSWNIQRIQAGLGYEGPHPYGPTKRWRSLLSSAASRWSHLISARWEQRYGSQQDCCFFVCPLFDMHWELMVIKAGAIMHQDLIPNCKVETAMDNSKLLGRRFTQLALTASSLMVFVNLPRSYVKEQTLIYIYM